MEKAKETLCHQAAFMNTDAPLGVGDGGCVGVGRGVEALDCMDVVTVPGGWRVVVGSGGMWVGCGAGAGTPDCVAAARGYQRA